MAKAATSRFALGVDYGTNSVRALVVDVADGSEVATHVYNYPSGEQGILLDPKDPNLARQNPVDYIKGFYKSVRGRVKAAARSTAASGRNGGGHRRRYHRVYAVAGRSQRHAAGHAAEIPATTWRPKPGCGRTTRRTPRRRRLPKRRGRLGMPYLAKCGGTYSSRVVLVEDPPLQADRAQGVCRGL